jgi:hypothetical protein
MWRQLGQSSVTIFSSFEGERDEVKIGFPGSRQGVKQAERDSSLVNLMLDSNTEYS